MKTRLMVNLGNIQKSPMDPIGYQSGVIELPVWGGIKLDAKMYGDFDGFPL